MMAAGFYVQAMRNTGSLKPAMVGVLTLWIFIFTLAKMKNQSFCLGENQFLNLPSGLIFLFAYEYLAST